MTLRAAAECLDASISKVSRLETGRGGVPVEDVAALLAVYGVRGDQRRDLLALTREADRRGWWQRRCCPTVPERRSTFLVLESRADHVVAFENVVVPGIFQTADCTRALMEDSGLGSRRSARGARAHSPRAKLAALARASAGTGGAHRRDGPRPADRRSGGLRQAARTPRGPRTSSEHPHPRGATRGRAGLDGAFWVLRLPSGNSVVFVENLTASLFIEERSEVAQYRGSGEPAAARTGPAANCGSAAHSGAAERSRGLGRRQRVTRWPSGTRRTRTAPRSGSRCDVSSCSWTSWRDEPAAARPASRADQAPARTTLFTYSRALPSSRQISWATWGWSKIWTNLSAISGCSVAAPKTSMR